MPLAGDAYLQGGQLPAANNPLNRIQLGAFSNKIDPLQIIAQWTQFFEDYLNDIIKDITGIDLKALGLLEPLETLQKILAALQGIDLSDPGSILAAIATGLGGLISALINGGQPINAGNLFGDIAAGLLSEIGLGSVSTAAPNLLVAGNFPNSASIESNPMWVWDAAVTSEADGSGAARTTCDGTLRVIRSTLVSVTPDQVVPVSGKFKWSGLSSTGNALAIGVREFFPNGTIHDIEIGHVNAPGAAGGFTQIGGNYTPTAGAEKFYVRGIVKATAVAGTVWWDGASATKPNTPSWFSPLLDLFGISQLEDFIGLDVDDIWSAVITTIMNPLSLLEDSAGRAKIQQTIDTVWTAITGGAETNNLLADLLSALRAIPFANVLGIGGPSNIGATQQATWDQWIGGLVGAVGSGAGLADLFNIGQDISSRATLGQMGWDILGIRSNKKLTSGFLPTSQSNISLATVSAGASMSTVPITQSTALTGYDRVAEAMSMGVVSWQGSGVTSVTDCYLNIYKMDTATGVNTLVHASSNIIGLLSGSMAPVVYSIAAPIDVLPGEVYGFEICIRGAGTHNVAGNQSALPDQSVYPRRWSSVRNSGVSAAPSTFTPTYGSNVPFVEYGVSASAVAIPHTPQINTVSAAGGSSLPIPSWANTVQVITLGGGGGGKQGGTYGVSGEGGENGEYAVGTWVRGVDFTGSPSISITVGAGGAGGTGNGGNGGNSSASITGHSVSSNGGEGGDALNLGGDDKEGQGPGNQAYGGVTYVGGPTQNSFGGNGAAPGGGGAGGNYVSFQAGGYGAAGAVWIRFVQ